MISTQQNIRDAKSFEFDGTRVLGEFEKACGEGVFERRGGVAQNFGKESHNGIHDDDGGDDTVGEDVVADGNFLVHEEVDDALIDAFVMAAEEDEMVALGGEALGRGLFERGACGGHKQHSGPLRAEGGESGENGFALHDHALAPAIGGVVGGAVFVRGPVADVVRVDFHEGALLGASDDAFSQSVGRDLGKEGQDVDAHAQGFALKRSRVANRAS